MSAEKQHYHGHRDRLRGRLVESGADSLQDYELLEIILFACIPRRDVKPLAKELIIRFKSLTGVLNAPHKDLIAVKGLSENTATTLKAISAIAIRSMKQDLTQKPLLNNWNRMLDYCHAILAHEIREHFHVLFLNKKNELLADERQGSGTVDHTPAYPREIMKRALDLGATALVLVHNHPSGDPTPSRDDIDLTHAIIAAGRPFDITVHDHLIMSRNGYKSFRNDGLI